MTSAPHQPRHVKKIFQPVRGRGIRKLLWKRLGIPRSVVHPLLSFAKRAVNPAQMRLRREVAREIEPSFRGIEPISKASGYRVFDAGVLPGVEAVVKQCQQIFEQSDAARIEATGLFNPRKRFLLTVLSGDEFLPYPELIRFMVSRPILDMASDYLGAVPMLAGAALWYTPVNETAQRSQCYHFDGEDESQLKVAINISDVDQNCGPFTLLPGDQSARFARALSSRERLSDEEVESAIGLEHRSVLTGPPGSGAFVDTSRCLHYGSRGNQRDRLVLIFQFLRFDCPTESTFRFDSDLVLEDFEPDAVQKLALGIH